MCNSSVEAMQDFGSLLRKPPAGLLVMLRIDEYSAPTEASTSFAQGSRLKCKFSEPQQRIRSSGIRMDYYVSMTALLIADN